MLQDQNKLHPDLRLMCDIQMLQSKRKKKKLQSWVQCFVADCNRTLFFSVFLHGQKKKILLSNLVSDITYIYKWQLEDTQSRYLSSPSSANSIQISNFLGSAAKKEGKPVQKWTEG